MLRGGSHHHLAHGGAAGEEDVVEGQGQQGPGGFRSALHQGHFLLGEEPGQQLRRKAVVWGVNSEGLSTAQLPAATAEISGPRVS